MLQWLQARGYWDALAARLQVRREGGFVGIDVVLFLLLYLATAGTRSLKRFGQWTQPFRRELAALGGRKAFATPSSVSRCLSAVEVADVRALTPWLLLEACDATALLQHPAAAAYDTYGQPWHAFDWDGTSTAFRHRALPSGGDLPPPTRRSAASATAGYLGRKRGEVRFMRATLQHAGTGLWLDAVVTPERSDTAAVLPSALDAIAATCRHAGLARERVVLRADGCGGNVPFITACRQRAVPFLVRSAHYGLLDEPAIMAALRQASWHEVPSSGSGPTRLAAELGDVLLQPSKHTTGADGERFEGVRVRMVASRFAATEKSGAGTVIDGWQYELYATDLPASAWPAPEAVELYYGRCGQENRFAQEDREFGLDRILSYHLPGQALATILALFLWNWRTAVGFAENPPPARAPTPTGRRAVPGAPLPRVDVEDAASRSPECAPRVAPAATAADVTAPAEAALAPPASVGAAVEPSLGAMLAQLPWHEITAGLPQGWQRTEAGDALRCHAGALLPVRAITPPRQGRAPRVEFLAALSSCRSCSAPERCVDAATTGSAKKVTRAISHALADALTPLLVDKEARRARREREQEQHLPHVDDPSAPPAPTSLLAPAAATPLGPFAITPPLLLPASLRRLAQDVLGSLDVRVDTVVPPLEPRHPALATSSAERQQRRLTWTQRLARTALPPGASVSVYFAGDTAILTRHLPDVEVPRPAA